MRPLPLPTKNERDIERACVKLASRYECTTYKLASNNRVGLPDRLFIRHNSAIFVEFKRPGRSPTRHQEQCIQCLRDAGLTVYVIDNIQDFIKYVIVGG